MSDSRENKEFRDIESAPSRPERFVYLMNKEPFDYTKWREDLYEGLSVREISALAMNRRKGESPLP